MRADFPFKFFLAAGVSSHITMTGRKLPSDRTSKRQIKWQIFSFPPSLWLTRGFYMHFKELTKREADSIQVGRNAFHTLTPGANRLYGMLQYCKLKLTLLARFDKNTYFLIPNSRISFGNVCIKCCN